MEDTNGARSGHAIVKWFNDAKGYGFLVDDSGEDIFVHYRSIVGRGRRTLAEGQKVRFTAQHGDKGWQATEVITDVQSDTRD